MDATGAAAVISAVSGLAASLSGIVLAFRVARPPGQVRSEVKTRKSRSRPLPPSRPNPGRLVALGALGLGVSHAKSGVKETAGHAACP